MSTLRERFETIFQALPKEMGFEFVDIDPYEEDSDIGIFLQYRFHGVLYEAYDLSLWHGPLENYTILASNDQVWSQIKSYLTHLTEDDNIGLVFHCNVLTSQLLCIKAGNIWTGNEDRDQVILWQGAK